MMAVTFFPFFFFFKQKTAYEIMPSLVGSEMCIRDRVQAAAAYISLGAPAGIGPAALNLRMLTKRGVSNALAVASVGLVQLAQFVTTLVLLLVLSLVSGSNLPLDMPSGTQLLGIAFVAVATVAIMFIPPIRQWLAAQVVPVWRLSLIH